MPRPALQLTPRLPSQNFLVGLLHHFRDSFSLGFDTVRALLWVVVMLMHLGLVLMKVELVDPRRSDFESFDVPRLPFH
jgi:hypothetical protein